MFRSLVQQEVARFTQVCSYDHSGIWWSESGPKDSCSLRVSEVHTALKNAGIQGLMCSLGIYLVDWLRASTPDNTRMT